MKIQPKQWLALPQETKVALIREAMEKTVAMRKKLSIYLGE